MNKGEPRIYVEGIYRAPRSGPNLGISSFCVNFKCIKGALERGNKSNRKFYPDFSGKVGVLKNIRWLDGSHRFPVIEGIEWVFM